MANFHPLEVVDCASESQLQVGANLNKWKIRIRVKILFALANNSNEFRCSQ